MNQFITHQMFGIRKQSRGKQTIVFARECQRLSRAERHFGASAQRAHRLIDYARANCSSGIRESVPQAATQRCHSSDSFECERMQQGSSATQERIKHTKVD